MGIHLKFIVLLTILLICSSILFFFKTTNNLSKLFFLSINSISTTVNQVFTCETWKNFSYLDMQEYEKCLKWRRNDAFWSVQGIRHTAFKNLLNSSSLIIEVGGNTGHDMLKFIELYNPFIISFEPLGQMSKSLMKKFQTNPKIEVQPYGLGNHARNLSIEPFDNENTGTSILRKLSMTNSSKIQQIQVLNVVQVIDNIRKTKTSNGIIDMISINCEGCEFEILPALILHNMTQYFRIIQFATHTDFLSESFCIYCQIEQALGRTHQTKYRYVMLWEAWETKRESAG